MRTFDGLKAPRPRHLLWFVPALVGVLAAGVGSSAAQAGTAGPGFAVVELFTSEGCSSCPPAEALLNELDAEAERENKAIYVLAFHVEYWDYLGWDDRFGQDPFADRQRRYGRKLERGRVYTPQMVVNGQTSFVGSNRSTAQREVGRALAKPSRAQIALKAKWTTSGEVEVRPQASGLPENARIVLAVVEDDLSSKVTSGENEGRRLVHRGVVRALKTLGGGAQGPVKFRLPEGTKRKNVEVVGFVQDLQSLSILGADRARVASR